MKALVCLILLCFCAFAAAHRPYRELLQADNSSFLEPPEANPVNLSDSCDSATPSPAYKVASEAFAQAALDLLPPDVRNTLPALPRLEELLDRATLLSLLDEAASIAQELFNYTLPVTAIKTAVLASGSGRKRQLLQTTTSGPLKTIVVPTYVWVAHLADGTGKVPAAKVVEQIDYMNEHFGPIGFEFKLAEAPTFISVARSVWEASSTSSAAADLMRQYRKGGPETLNIFIRKPTIRGASGTLLGYATFPDMLCSRGRISSNRLALDGLNIRYDTLPGIRPSFDPTSTRLGATAVHEAGHWVGLYHTFSQAKDTRTILPSGGSCEARFGDFVSDTQAERLPADGCPRNRQSCPGGPDPVTNFMDYSDDSCFIAFTSMQGARAQNQYQVFRLGKKCDGSQVRGSSITRSTGAQVEGAAVRVEWLGLWTLVLLLVTYLFA